MAAKHSPERFRTILNSFIHQSPVEKTSSEVATSISKFSSKSRTKEDFYKRLSSYNSLTWFAKPAWLAPPNCARYGWENVGVDVLRCVSCKSHLSGHLPQSSQPSVYEHCCQKLEDSLKTGHNVCCSWASNPCPVSYLGIEFHDVHTEKMKLFDHIKNLILLGNRIPKITNEIFEEVGIDSELFEKLKTWVQAELCNQSIDVNDLTDDEITSACVLALCGWNNGKAHRIEKASCSNCFREAGVWNYWSVTSQGCEVESDDSESCYMSPIASAQPVEAMDVESNASADNLRNGSTSADDCARPSSCDTSVKSDQNRTTDSHEKKDDTAVPETNILASDQENSDVKSEKSIRDDMSTKDAICKSQCDVETDDMMEGGGVPSPALHELSVTAQLDADLPLMTSHFADQSCDDEESSRSSSNVGKLKTGGEMTPAITRSPSPYMGDASDDSNKAGNSGGVISDDMEVDNENPSANSDSLDAHDPKAGNECESKIMETKRSEGLEGNEETENGESVKDSNFKIRDNDMEDETCANNESSTTSDSMPIKKEVNILEKIVANLKSVAEKSSVPDSVDTEFVNNANKDDASIETQEQQNVDDNASSIVCSILDSVVTEIVQRSNPLQNEDLSSAENNKDSICQEECSDTTSIVQSVIDAIDDVDNSKSEVILSEESKACDTEQTLPEIVGAILDELVDNVVSETASIKHIDSKYDDALQSSVVELFCSKVGNSDSGENEGKPLDSYLNQNVENKTESAQQELSPLKQSETMLHQSIIPTADMHCNGESPNSVPDAIDQHTAEMNRLNMRNKRNLDHIEVQTVSEPQRKRLKKPKKTHFHPVGEHRPWCAWVRQPMSITSPTKNGNEQLRDNWNELLSLVTSQHSPNRPGLLAKVRTTPTYEGLRSIRHFISDWASPITPPVIK